MNREKSGTIAIRILVLGFALGTPSHGRAQEVKTPYPHMAPLAQYLIADQNVEIAMARSAAPQAISREAEILVLGQRGYETAVKGKNGFVCIVERSWMSPFDTPEFWNPSIRGPICYNPPAARSILLFTFYRTKLVLAGISRDQMLKDIRSACARKELPSPEPGSMSYMMSKDAYLGDAVRHWHPHLMFHVPKTDGSTWGANLSGSPVLLNAQFTQVPEPETIFMVPLDNWADGTPAPMPEHDPDGGEKR